MSWNPAFLLYSYADPVGDLVMFGVLQGWLAGKEVLSAPRMEQTPRDLWIAGMGKSRVEEQQIRVKMANYILLVREQLRRRIDIVRIDHEMVYLSCYNNLNDNLNLIANSTECREQTLYNYQVRVSFKDDHMHFSH